MNPKPTSIAALSLSFMVFALAVLPASAQPAASGVEKSDPPADDRPGEQPVPPPAAGDQKAADKELKLPGLTINAKERFVDLEATVCLDEGALELIACTKDSKEHESIVSVEARPVHIHTALLLLGARNGNPAMRRPINEEMTRWVDIPPQGDLIDVFLEFKDAEGKLVERPISDFIARSSDEAHEPGAGETEVAEADRFPHTFIFAGSQLQDNGDGPKEYLADMSGHVISIATFGDELLCLPQIYSQDNGALMWRIDSTHLPKRETKVTLRLRLKKVSDPKPNP